jgi:hypothetical protein
MDREELLKQIENNAGLSSGRLDEILCNIAACAPSTHNTQPWSITFDSYTQEYVIRVRLEAWTSSADPEKRDLYISIGALMENFRILLKAFNLYESVQVHVESHVEVRVKRKSLKEETMYFAAKGDMDLIKAVIYRQNYRGEYKQPSMKDKKRALKIARDVSRASEEYGNVSYISDVMSIEKVGKLIDAGIRSAYKDSEFRNEISSLINHNTSPKKYGIHGYSLGMNLHQSFILPFLIKHLDIGRILAKKNTDTIMTITGMCCITSLTDTLLDWINSGIILQRLAVKMHVAGFATSIFAAPIEMGFRAETSDLFGLRHEYPNLLVAVGLPSRRVMPSKRIYISLERDTG